MSYRKQYITIGEQIVSSILTQIETNCEAVRTQHKGSTEPTEIQDGMLWLDDTIVPWALKIYGGTSWITLAKIDPAEVEAHGSNQYYVDDSTGAPIIDTDTGVGFNICAEVTQDTWETIGPTGSGANNIWAIMDEVPTDADWIEIKCSQLDVYNNSGPTVELNIYAASASYGTPLAAATQIARLRQQSPSAAYGGQSSTGRWIVPVNASNLWKVYWDLTVGSTASAFVHLVGWGKNR